MVTGNRGGMGNREGRRLGGWGTGRRARREEVVFKVLSAVESGTKLKPEVERKYKRPE